MNDAPIAVRWGCSAPDTSLAALRLERLDATAAEKLADELADLYREVYGAQQPQASNPFYSRERFLERLAGYQRAPGFALITARDASDELVAFLHGYPLPAGSRWWSVLQPQPPADFVVEDGARSFAINDMVVRPDWRRRGVARALHDEVRAAHPDMRFTLTVRPDNDAARAAYLSWGYRVIGKQQPYPDSPVFETMLLDPVLS
jgi:ribosomal protein S18 acetylase RimI-like enzyme